MRYDLKNIVPLGVLEWGIYPAHNKSPIIYLYYRPNGDLMLYRTTDEIELNLTTVSSYDNTILFKFYSKEDISKLDITKFDSRTIDVNKSNYIYPFNKIKQEYIYILVPAIYNLFSITINNIISTNLFDMVGIYEHNNKFYYIYRSSTKINIENIINVQVIINQISINEGSQFVKHIEDYNDPHKTIELLLNSKVLSKIEWSENNDLNKIIDLHIIRGTTLELSSIPIIDKQILFNTETSTIFVDNTTTRQSYGNGGGSGSGIQSSTITNFEVVTTLPSTMLENVLYARIIPYNDGVGYMDIQPEFIVR